MEPLALARVWATTTAGSRLARRPNRRASRLARIQLRIAQREENARLENRPC